MTLASDLHALKVQERTLRRRGFIPVPGAARASIQGHVGTHQFVATVGLTLPSLDAGGMQALADAVANAWNAHFLMGGPGATSLNRAYVFDSVVLTDQSSQSGAQAVSTQHSGQAGLATGDMYPLNVCVVASFRTGHRGRDHRGRMYLGPIDVGYGDGNGPNAGAISGLLGAFQGFSTAITAAGSGLAILSRVNSPGAAYPVTNVLISPKWGSQRRRLH